MALGRLIVAAVDRRAGQMTPKQRPNRPVRRDGEVPPVMLCYDHPDGGHHPGLGIDGAFPAAIALVRRGKKPVGTTLEFRGWQKTRAAAVVFAQRRVDLDGNPSRAGKYLRRLDRLALGACPDRRDR